MNFYKLFAAALNFTPYLLNPVFFSGIIDLMFTNLTRQIEDKSKPCPL